MEKSAVAEAPAYVRWEEVSGSGDKGRMEVSYFLKREDGSSDLAVVGKEKSRPRHMPYRYTIRDRSLLSILPSPSHLKLRSRTEVIDWLNSIVTESISHRSVWPPNTHVEDTDLHRLDIKSLKDIQLQKLGHYTKEFLWLGSAWTCRKKRRHYHSFCRDGVKISVHDFVFVLAEENNRLVAYLEDMYEDFKSNKMVVVRWFHKIDEVGIVLPNNFNDREIFFSLCLQDLSIECIDGLSTVLSPPHFEKFLNEATHTQLEPYVCHRQFENDDVKPFDITQVKGYWKQEILRYMFTYSSANVYVKPQLHDGCRLKDSANNGSSRSKKMLRRSCDCDESVDFTNKQDWKKEYIAADGGYKKKDDNGLIYFSGGNEKCGSKDDYTSAFSAKETIKQTSKYLLVGSQVEVLCQDSGLRGCWFRAMIIKKQKDKVKVQYQDIRDAVDGANNLEEWLLASRVAIPDGLGLRKCGRNTIRPSPQCNKSIVSWAIDVGCVVDVWWHDGWWEGIVIEKKFEDQFHVYFPGEKRKSIFGCSNLRHSQEWFGGSWEHVKESPDVVKLILSEKEGVGSVGESAYPSPVNVYKDNISVNDKAEDKPRKIAEVVWDLSKDDSLSLLKWNSSTKRKRGSGSTIQKPNHSVSVYNVNETEAVRSRSCERRFLLPKSLNADLNNYKNVGDTVFSSPVIAHLTNMVMSR